MTHAKATSMDAEKLFLANLDTIDRVCADTCRSRGCYGDEADEFAAEVKLRLLEDDYRRLQEFRGDASLRTYLRVVVGRLFLDWMDKRLGKWRPCAIARAMGPVAVQLDILLHRDGYTFDEACELLAQKQVQVPARDKLEEMAALLPQRPPRRFHGIDDLAEVEATDNDVAAHGVLHREKSEILDQVNRQLPEALAELPAEDQQIVKLHFFEGIKGPEVARVLGIAQRRFYNRKDAALKLLRHHLESRGVTAAMVEGIIGWECSERAVRSVRRGLRRRPSVSMERGS